MGIQERKPVRRSAEPATLTLNRGLRDPRPRRPAQGL